MRIYLLSDEGRWDILDYWRFCRTKFWPGCPWAVTISGSPKKEGWARTMLRELQTMPDAYIMLWLDDQFLSASVWPPALVGPMLDKLYRCPMLAGIQLSYTRWADGDKLPELPGYAFYRYKDPLYNMTQIIPGIWKRDVLIRICTYLCKEYPRVMDRGWTGAYNYELYAPLYLKESGLRVAGPTSAEHVKIKVYNGVIQNQWSETAVRQAQQLGYTLNISEGPRGVYVQGEDPYMDMWREARVRGRKILTRLERQRAAQEREENAL